MKEGEDNEKKRGEGGCVETYRPQLVFTHIIATVSKSKGMFCDTCKDPRSKELYECSKCNRTWCSTCWENTHEEVEQLLSILTPD
jgi:hypothetical protein